MIDTGPSKHTFTPVKQAGHGQVGPEARALGLGRAWLGPGPGLGVFTRPSPPRRGRDPGWPRAAGPDGPLLGAEVLPAATYEALLRMVGEISRKDGEAVA